MNPSTPNSEIHGAKNEIQNEVEATKTENTEKVTTLQIFEMDNRQQNTNVHQTNNEFIIKPLATEVRKEQMVRGYYGANKIGNRPQEFWVQFNFAGGHNIPEGGGAPLYYEPDRNLFVRLVFSIVLFMLIITAGYVMFVYMTDVKQIYIRYGSIIMIMSMLGMLGLNYAMMCSACTRTPPCNFICLFLAVCFMSCIAAYITARYKTQVVLLALLATTVTVVVCLCLACTKFDFTQFLLYVIVVAVAFSAIAMIVGITMLVTNTRYKPIVLVILVIGTLLNVVILIMELQMILGGRTVEMSEDDYALGAFMLYTSIVDIFLKLVQLMGICDEGF